MLWLNWSGPLDSAALATEKIGILLKSERYKNTKVINMLWFAIWHQTPSNIESEQPFLETQKNTTHRHRLVHLYLKLVQPLGSRVQAQVSVVALMKLIYDVSLCAAQSSPTSCITTSVGTLQFNNDYIIFYGMISSSLFLRSSPPTRPTTGQRLEAENRKNWHFQAGNDWMVRITFKIL